MACETKKLSKMLFEARESIEMLADIVEARSGKPDRHNRLLVVEIDDYRASKGWNPSGFGRECDD